MLQVMQTPGRLRISALNVEVWSIWLEVDRRMIGEGLSDSWIDEASILKKR